MKKSKQRIFLNTTHLYMVTFLVIKPHQDVSFQLLNTVRIIVSNFKTDAKNVPIIKESMESCFRL